MRFTDRLPTPPAEALAHSEQLAQRIRAAITTNDGSIPFREFMRMALYEPGLGYYVAGLRKIGKEGDFITAPEISPLFSQCLANQCAQVLAELGGGDMLELGAGSGVMAADMLLRLETLGCLPAHYWILDLSPELRDRQRQTLQATAPHLLARVEWLDTLPAEPIRGVIIGNEVLDAMPVELFTLVNGARVIRQVEMQGAGFGLTAVAGGTYTSEYNPALPGWMRSMADTLETGVMILIDYGYEQKDYYHPDRSQGTLICHYQHRVHDNPLLWPGLQDITASVDFTAVAEAGVDAGLELAGYATQAAFLASSGLEELFLAALEANPANQYPLAQQVRTLSLPSEMGERFKVIALSKGFTPGLVGFRLADQRHRL
ncbi:SAM-dependent methyltransferase [Candidatus Thiothrix sp. Deng01]|uniref:SAM-dependent methyltransferase n=1 Tax=Candidatus Thiothrix phosphatis TaxID=3112415 RepID=A0ABU6CY40_9GAMM|nr:SAM-dependent methyltransferase [Candidatus Thiothrix sp. Deng01]MEB4591018.1 SAM-dependent methyltransferase [Candidatus Thiothrix sp. Deng01]